MAIAYHMKRLKLAKETGTITKKEHRPHLTPRIAHSILAMLRPNVQIVDHTFS